MAEGEGGRVLWHRAGQTLNLHRLGGDVIDDDIGGKSTPSKIATLSSTQVHQPHHATFVLLPLITLGVANTKFFIIKMPASPADIGRP